MKLSNYFWRCVLDWYLDNKRNYPWRNTVNPYKILTAEILLQQTHVRKVEDVYINLLKKYPSVRELANSDVLELRRIVSPVGLVYRADRLKQIAELLINNYNGMVPNKAEELLKLPGVGNYIAKAVLCYAYNKNTVPIDTNVIRLFSRYFLLSSSKARARDDKELAEKIIKYFDFQETRIPNLAVLDFSSEVCSSRIPKCNECKLSFKCLSKKIKG